jgi:hypothetical protein
VVGIATGYGLNGQGDQSSSPGTSKIFLLSMLSRPVLGTTQPPIQWVLGVLPLRVKRLGHETDPLLKLVPKSRIRGSIHPLPHMSSW